MNQQLLVVEASLINLLFVKDIFLGRGKDLIYGTSCIIYKLIKNKNNKIFDFVDDWGCHALQIYENLNQVVFEAKVLQLQKAMTVHLNPYSTRIILIGKEQVQPMQFNLYVVYEFEHILTDIKSLSEKGEGFDYEEAKNFLTFLCQNYILGAQFTNEFLDISPQNIFKTDTSYIVSNFGITFDGTKFSRIYLSSTDPIYKEKKPTQNNILYSYAFKAALLTLCLMTQIDPKDFFFDDGQFKEHILDNLLYLIYDREEKDIRRDRKFIITIPEFFKKLSSTREQDYNQQKIKNHGKPFKYVKSERFLKYKYHDKIFLDIFRKLLNVTNIQSRSIFPQLVSKPENILSVENPYNEVEESQYNFQNGTFCNKKLNGCGIISEEEEQTKKQNKPKITQKCGQFQEGQVTDAFNIINIHKTKFECTLNNMQCALKFRYVNNELLYLTDDIVSPINPIGKSPKESIYIFKGKIKGGKLQKGISYQLDKTIFEGEFLNNQPLQGKMIYPNSDVFEGTMEGFKKKEGVLITKQMRFEGQFQNDQFLKGFIQYQDGGAFQGYFKNGQKVKAGIYKYPHSQIQYIGLYDNNERHGQGVFIDKSQENCIQEVVYNYGKCETKLNNHFIEALKEIKEKRKQQKIFQQYGNIINDQDEDLD